MRTGPGHARAGLAALLLAVAGCEYWENLIEEKPEARADLDLTVQDAWTGELLSDTYCKDRDKDSLLPPYDQGRYRFASAPTGVYTIHCEHEWYFEKVFDVDLTVGGARNTVRLVRRGLSDWYPDPEKRVTIPGGDTLRLRFPLKLDWYATPSDDSGMFHYEWTFLRTPQLDMGHALPNGPLPKESLFPRLQRSAPAAAWMKEGTDTVILNVRSMMNGSKNAYLVGSDTATLIWTRNIKPRIEFVGNVSTYNVGCPSQSNLERLRFYIRASDTDGTCDSIHLWAANAPSLPGLDVRYACSEIPDQVFELKRPNRPGRFQNDREEYENILIAEAIDDNGETGRDTLTFTTFIHPAPTVDLRIVSARNYFFMGEPVEFKLTASTTYKGFEQLELEWKANGKTDYYTHIVPDNLKQKIEYGHTRSFDTVGSYTVRGYAVHGCGTATEVDSLPFTVAKNTPPSITEIKPRPANAGDSGLVAFFLSASDPDATAGYDHIAKVELRWSDATQSRIDTAATSLRNLPLEHRFRLATGEIPSVEILIWDEHAGMADTTYRFELPAQ